jgi:uncharacterized protein
MDITPVIPDSYNVITGYSKGSFLINEERYSGNIIISRDKIWTWDNCDIDNLSKESFETIIKDVTSKASRGNIILLVGLGENHKVASFKLSHALSVYNINIDIMSTAAACRTYNILLAEGREVYAALKGL